MNKEQLSELDQCLASLEISKKELKSCMSGQYSQEDMASKMNSLADNMYASMSSLRNYVYDMHQKHSKRMDEHMDASKHLPPITGPGKMQACLAKLGIDDDYEVHKKPIFASSSYASVIKAGKHGIKVELDLNKPKN